VRINTKVDPMTDPAAIAPAVRSHDCRNSAAAIALTTKSAVVIATTPLPEFNHQSPIER